MVVLSTHGLKKCMQISVLIFLSLKVSCIIQRGISVLHCYLQKLLSMFIILCLKRQIIVDTFKTIFKDRFCYKCYIYYMSIEIPNIRYITPDYFSFLKKQNFINRYSYRLIIYNNFMYNKIYGFDRMGSFVAKCLLYANMNSPPGLSRVLDLCECTYLA